MDTNQGSLSGSPDTGRTPDIARVPSTVFHVSASSDASERTPLLGQTREPTDDRSQSGGSWTGRPTAVKLYRRRWYILLLYSLLGALQGFIWNTWGPIAASAKVAFSWEDSDIALQANWGTITYLISAIFFAWLLDVKGLRVSSLSVAGLMFIASGIRCITLEKEAATWLINVASVLNGFGGAVPTAGSPLLSATWFPAKERTRATAFLFGMNVFGIAISFIVAPLFVHLPTNGTAGHTVHDTNVTNLLNSSMYTKEQIADLHRGIRTYLYTQFGMATIVALAILLYFPAKPPTPPSVSAGIKRIEFVKGIKDLARSKAFWMIGGACGLSAGICNAWTAVINVNLNPLGIPESTVGFIAFVGMTAGIVCGVVFSVFADLFVGHSKPFLIALYSIGSCAYLIFALECEGLIAYHLAILYITMIVGSICIAGSAPLLYELTCEETYPVAEGVTCMGVSFINNFCGAVFLLIFFIPIRNENWMNWVLFGSFIVCIPLFAAYRPSYSRLKVDKQQES